jgi:hypothetical protein
MYLMNLMSDCYFSREKFISLLNLFEENLKTNNSIMPKLKKENFPEKNSRYKLSLSTSQDEDESNVPSEGEDLRITKEINFEIKNHSHPVKEIEVENLNSNLNNKCSYKFYRVEKNFTLKFFEMDENENENEEISGNLSIFKSYLKSYNTSTSNNTKDVEFSVKYQNESGGMTEIKCNLACYSENYIKLMKTDKGINFYIKNLKT